MTLKTSDLAICAGVSQCSVREYSDLGLLGPVPRAEGNNYRSFDPQQIPQLYLLKTLREMGYSAQQIRDYGRKRSPEQAKALFSRCSMQLADEVAHLQAKLDIMQTYLALIEEGQSYTPGEIELKNLPEWPIRRSFLTDFSGRGKPIDRLNRAHEQIRQNGNAGCPMGLAFDDFMDMLEQPEQPTQLISYDPQGPDLRPAGEYLVGTESCFYGEQNGLPRRMFEYTLHHNLEFCGPAYTVYLLDAASVINADQYLMQIAVEVKRAEPIPVPDSLEKLLGPALELDFTRNILE